MPQIFIGNPSTQHRRFCYRIPERPLPRTLHVPALSQVKIEGNFDDDVTKFIVQQLEAFGAVPKSDLNSIRSPRALVYYVGRNPIEEGKLDEAQKLDLDARQDVATKQTENAGLALLNTAEKATGKPNSIASTSMEIKQVDDMGEVKKGVNFEVGVDRTAGKMRSEKKPG